MRYHYILLDIINKCNKSCSYCVMKEWRNNPEYPDKLTWQQIGLILKSYEGQGQLVVDITGGEPTLFADLLTVLDMLKHYNAKVILRTNGIGLGTWRKNYRNMIVVLAKHDTPDEQFEGMKSYLLPWDHIQLGADPKTFQRPDQNMFDYHRDDKNDNLQHQFSSFLFVTNGAEVKECPGEIKAKPFENFMCKREMVCDSCPYANLAWDLAFNYLPEK